MTKDILLIARGKEDTIFVAFGYSDSMIESVVEAQEDVGNDKWYYRLGHMSDNGMQVTLTKRKPSGSIYVTLESCEDCVLERCKVNFKTSGEPLKLQQLEQVHTGVWGPTHLSFFVERCSLLYTLITQPVRYECISWSEV